MQLLPLIALAPLLLAVAWMDFRYMRIPNYLVLIAVALFVVTVPLIGLGEAAMRLMFAALGFGLLVIAFCLRILAGGDVKMLGALLLFIPTQTYTLFGFAFAASMLIGVMAIVLLRRTPYIRELDFVSIQSPGTFPMGISISAAGLLHPFLVQALI